MSEPLGLIEDGMTRHGYIAPLAGIHPAMRFDYRPVTILERSAWSLELDRRTERHRATAELLARKVLTWDVKNGNSELLSPKDPESYLKLEPLWFDRISSIVTGYSASDPDPRGSADDPFRPTA